MNDDNDKPWSDYDWAIEDIDPEDEELRKVN